MDKIASNIISYLRFPLCVAIVMIHSDLGIYNTTAAQSKLYDAFSSLWINYICCEAVPLFFFISGYLFFHENSFSFQIYKNKIRNRVHSILIPYLLWNMICFVFLFIMQRIFSNFNLLLHKQISAFVPQDYLYIFWNLQKVTGISSDQQGPLVGQFWFLQCLFVFALLSPCIYYCIKKTKILLIIGILLLCIWDVIPSVPGFNVVSLYYFSLGAFFGITKTKWYTDNRRTYLLVGLVYSLIYMLNRNLHIDNLIIIDETLLLFIILGITYHVTKGNKPNKRVQLLCQSSFFVFAIHRYFTSMGLNLFKNWQCNHGIEAIIIFFVISLFAILCSVTCYFLLCHFSPKMTQILNGNRIR